MSSDPKLSEAINSLANCMKDRKEADVALNQQIMKAISEMSEAIAMGHISKGQSVNKKEENLGEEEEPFTSPISR